MGRYRSKWAKPTRDEKFRETVLYYRYNVPKICADLGIEPPELYKRAKGVRRRLMEKCEGSFALLPGESEGHIAVKRRDSSGLSDLVSITLD